MSQFMSLRGGEADVAIACIHGFVMMPCDLFCPSYGLPRSARNVILLLPRKKLFLVVGPYVFFPIFVEQKLSLIMPQILNNIWGRMESKML